MSIVLKTMGKNDYAYIAFRQGPKVIHKYLGPISNPEVVRKIEALKSDRCIPEKYHNLFWDVNSQKIDLRKNARYIIERVLEIGGLDAVQWIQKIYPTNLIIETCETSRKISSKSRNFWQIWFGVSYAH